MSLDHKIITIKHSSMVAKAAYFIASKTDGVIDHHKAHMAGTIHDIGKLYIEKSESKYTHPIVGYDLMMKNNDKEMAEICISHPFPVFNDYRYIKNYCANDETAVKRIISTLKTIENTTLIKLIQFADKISGEDSYIRIEDKIKWYIEKYNINPKTIEQNYSEFNKIKKELDSLTNCDVYKLLGISD